MKEFSHLFSQLQMLASGMDRRGQFEAFQPGAWRPPIDIYEMQTSILVVVELPGLAKQEIDVQVEGKLLTISGSRNKRIPEGAQHVHQMEIPYGGFIRRIELPTDVEVDQIEARYEEGYLMIEIPRSRL